jgi:outer membrane lipoprotein SlyB
MKKIFATLMMIAMIAISVPVLSSTASAQTRYGTYSTSVYRGPSFYQRHRNVANIGIATGAGALIGALIGGGRGAGVGALLGAGGGALYTYKIRPKRYNYYPGY